jgi:nucleoside-diphosphate-sugar epimerase
MPEALVTGAAGFVGRHLVPKLQKAGYFVCTIDPASNQGSVEQIVHAATHFQISYDVVVHLAANILDVDARTKAGLAMYDDILLDMKMCRYLEEFPPRQCFVAMSSCATDFPDDPYAWVKLTLEKFAGALHRQKVPVAILRPFSGYGPDQALSYPFPAILNRAIKKEDPLTVWGSGTQVRDWIHIEDLTDAILWAIHSAPRGIPIDIGTGIGTDFASLATMMASALGYSPEVKALADKAEASKRRVADTALASQHGFTAKISLEEGIRRALETLNRAQR